MAGAPEAAITIAATNLIITHGSNVRRKYKSVPAVWDTRIAAHKNLQTKVKESSRYRLQNNSEYHRESIASQKGREREAKKILRNQENLVEKARRLREMNDNKEGNWFSRAGKRVFYDQYDAERGINQELQEMDRLEKWRVEHERRVVARERQRKEDARRPRDQLASHNVRLRDDGRRAQQSPSSIGRPSLSRGTTIVEYNSQDERQHDIPARGYTERPSSRGERHCDYENEELYYYDDEGQDESDSCPSTHDYPSREVSYRHV